MTPPLDSPLIPLPPPPPPPSRRSAINERVIQPANDPNDLFDSLLTTEDTIFQSPSQLAYGEGREASSPLRSDFGAFVSVPTPEETREHPLLLDFDDNTPPAAIKPKKTNFFDHITEEARKNHEQNQKRVANQISQFEQDSLLRAESIGRSTSSPPSFINQQQSSPPASQFDYMTQQPHSSISSQTMPEQTQSWKASNSVHNERSDSLSTATLPRKWMSNFLNASVSSLPYTVKHGTVKSPHRNRSDSPPVTHSSPFAPHIFAPPSGAPGFAGDYSWNKNGFVFDENDNYLRRLKLEGRKENTTPVLKLELAEQIRANLPPLPRLVKLWTLLYSSDQHGVSLQTLYSRCASKISSTLVAIQDSDDCVFGVWMGGAIHSSSAYYGTGDSFLWTSRDRKSVQTFKWTGKNDYVALCDKDFISFGGGTGKYGLYLSENLTDGSSASCPTFNNPVLSGSSVHDASDMTIDFECVGVEIWGITN